MGEPAVKNEIVFHDGLSLGRGKRCAGLALHGVPAGIAMRAIQPRGADCSPPSRGVGGTSDAHAGSVQVVGVNHCGEEIVMAERFLHGADVAAVSSKSVAKQWRRVRGGL
ncbi:MAG: hypothetical protein JWL59_4885 [Chthoniobacteraceae bacterium]|nr:hypothetical protein [Chthoniobacteraceae bacterium]